MAGSNNEVCVNSANGKQGAKGLSTWPMASVTTPC